MGLIKNFEPCKHPFPITTHMVVLCINPIKKEDSMEKRQK
jgi:hypothetical protein